MKKGFLALIVIVLILTGILGFGIASSGLKLVGDSVTTELEEASQDPIVLGEGPFPALSEPELVQPESSPTPYSSPQESPSSVESASESSDENNDIQALSLPQEFSPQDSGDGGLSSLALEDSDVKPGVAPKSSVDYLTNTDETTDRKDCVLEDGVRKAYLNYMDVVGHGTSKDNSFTITNVQTKLDDLAFVDGVCDDGNCGDLDFTEFWHTKTNKNLAEGWHTLWGRAKNANSNLEQFSVNNSCMFCIDKQDPGQPGKPTLARDEEEVCDAAFASGEEISFSWESGDNGCANVSFFDVFVEINTSEGLEEREMTASSNSVKVGGLENGNKVRISVQPTDKSGNQGPVSEWSDWITIDNGKPHVEILTQSKDWIMGDFVVEENDSDPDGNLWMCFFKIKNNGNLTTPKSSKHNDYVLETSCTEPLLINVSLYCPQDGECKVFKEVRDKACNKDQDNEAFKVDNHGPELMKIIGEPKYFDGKFLRKSTLLTIIATDLGAGVNETCYKFINMQTGFMEERCAEGGEIELRFWDNESQHDLMFWAIDGKGMRTEMNQTHFVDETPPITMKTYSLIFQKLGEFMGIENFTMDWIGPNTKIMLNASDKEPHPSGVQKTLFRLFLLDEEEEGHPEWYGKKTGAWYDDSEECEEDNMIPEPEPSPVPDMNESNESEQNESDGIGIGNGESGCVAVDGWMDHPLLEDHEEYDKGWQIYNGEGIMISAEHEMIHKAHKICFKSVDNVWNWEEQQCQVFFVDTTPPVITPLGLPNNQCQKSVTADIVDSESGVMKAWVEWIDENETVVLKKDMKFHEELVKLDLSQYQWDATFTPEELAMLNAGDYTVRITAEDGVGNRHTVDIEDQLKKVVCVLNIAPSQCIVNSITGGNCMFNFNVIVRGGHAVQMGMENLFGLSPQNLSTTISNSFGSKAVGNDMLWNGGVLQINNTLGSNRGSFKLNMDIPASVTGTEVLDYFLRPQTVV